MHTASSGWLGLEVGVFLKSGAAVVHFYVLLEVVEHERSGLGGEMFFQEPFQPLGLGEPRLIEELVRLDRIKALAQPAQEFRLVQTSHPDDLLEMALQPIAEPRRQAALAQASHPGEQHSFAICFVTRHATEDAQAALQAPPPTYELLLWTDLALEPWSRKSCRATREEIRARPFVAGGVTSDASA